MTKEEQELRVAYRNLFGRKAGQRVFTHMLAELGVFNTSDPADPEKAYLRNYGIVLLKRCGILTADAEGRVNMELIVQKLFSIPLTE